jgi:hypothetical protein
METNESATKAVPQAKPEKLTESLAAWQKLTDPKERKAFYEKHPELRAVFSEGNFHSA